MTDTKMDCLTHGHSSSEEGGGTFTQIASQNGCWAAATKKMLRIQEAVTDEMVQAHVRPVSR